METLPEVEEPKETPQISAYDSPIPTALTSVSSSSASPNSVRLNQDYFERQQLLLQQQQQQKISTNIENDSKIDESSISENDTSINLSLNKENDLILNNQIDLGVGSSEDDNDSDVKTPLLENKNSNNLNSINFSGNEKESLLAKSKGG